MEVVSRSLVVAVGAIAENGAIDGVVGTETKRSLALLPSGIEFGFPVSAILRTPVVVSPRGCLIEDGFALCLRFRTAPTEETITCWGFSTKGGRSKDVTTETVCRELLLVVEDARCWERGNDGSFLFGCGRKLHWGIVAQGVGHCVLTAVSELVAQFVGCIRRGRSPAPPASATTFECHRSGDTLFEFIDNLLATIRLKYASSHNAEGIDEAFAECVVLQHVEEDGDEFYLGGDSSDFPSVCVVGVVKVVEGEGLLFGEVAERSAGAVEGEVEVEDDEAETSVVGTLTIAFPVVVWPVVAAEVEFHSHVVDVLVHIDELADFSVVVLVVCILSELVPLQECLPKRIRQQPQLLPERLPFR